jgi:hypothetical protein
VKAWAWLTALLADRGPEPKAAKSPMVRLEVGGGVLISRASSPSGALAGSEPQEASDVPCPLACGQGQAACP